MSIEFKELHEKIKKQRVIRDGKKVLKKSSDKDGYKINSDGKEVKQTSAEKINRKRAQRKASIKRKAGKSKASAKRKRSMSLK